MEKFCELCARFADCRSQFKINFRRLSAINDKKPVKEYEGVFPGQ